MSSIAEWTPNNFYIVGDTVIYIGTNYKCVQNNFSSSANDPTHATYWGGFSSGSATAGNGINVDTVGSVSTISTNIVNGTNTIVQYNRDKSVQINASNSGLTTVNGGTAIGVDKTNPSQPTINLLVDRGSGVLVNNNDALQLIHGKGLDVEVDLDGNGTLVNSGLISLTLGDGLANDSKDPQNPILRAVTGSGLYIDKVGAIATNNGVGLGYDSQTKLVNTGVLSITAGSGITSSGGQNPTITNNGIISVTAGSGLSSTGGKNPTINLLVAEASGIRVNPDPDKNYLQLQHGEGLDVTIESDGSGTLVNSGVLSVTATAGIGISVNNTDPQNPILTNTGIRALIAGTGISSSGSSIPTISNTGVLSVVAGTGLTSTGGQNPTLGLNLGTGLTTSGGNLANSGVLAVVADTGLTSSGGQNPTIGLNLGSGLSLTGGQLTNSGVINLTAGTGLTIAGTKTNYTLANSGVLGLTAGTGVTITGTKSNYTISAPTVSPTIYTATYRTVSSQTITGGNTFNGNLRWENATYSTPASMSISSQSGGGSSLTLWRCPIGGVWSISLSMSYLYTPTPTAVVMLQYTQTTEYLPRLGVVEGINLTGSTFASVAGTALLTNGSLYCISTPPASTVDVTFNSNCVWTLTYLGPSP